MLTRLSVLQIYFFLVLSSLVLSGIGQHAHHHRHHRHKHHHHHHHHHHKRHHRQHNGAESYYRSPENREEELFLAKCNLICKCFRKSDMPGIAETLTDDLRVQCTSIKNLWTLSQSQGIEGMPIELEVSDNNIQKINGSCAIEVMNTTKACFSTEKIFPLFKSVQKLVLRGFAKLTNLGNEESDFFTLMPNLKTLTLDLGTHHVVNIYFSYSTQNLKSLEITLSQGEILHIRCHNKVCLPSMLQTLDIRYNNSSELEFIDSQRFSKTLNDVTIESSGNSQYVTFLSGSNIQNLELKLQDHDDLAVSLKDVKITRSFVVNLSPLSGRDQHYKQLNEIYKDQKLKQLVKFQYTNNQINSFPAIIGSPETTFKRAFFGACHFSHTILENSKQTISTAGDGSKRLTLRDWYIDLKSINDRGLFQQFDEIVVTAYHVDISESFQIPNEKKIMVYYFEIGTTTKNIPKIYQSVFVNVTSNNSFSIKDLKGQAVPYQYSTASDAIFARAIALCILKNAGTFVKHKSGSNSLFDIESKEFWEISRKLPNNITFGHEYTTTEKSLAWEALASMNKYLRMVVRQNTKMKELSDVTLQPLNEGEYVLTKYGKTILQNEKTDFNAASVVELKKFSKTYRSILLDHLYHMIIMNKERVNHVFDSHVNGRPLLFQLVTMFNEYKRQVDLNQDLFERVSKRTNSYRNTKTITVIVQSLALLFEDKRAFEHTIKGIDDDWKPLKTQAVVDSLKDIRNLMLTLDDISISFGKLKSKIELKQQLFLKYVDSIVKLLGHILVPIRLSSLDGIDRKNVKRLVEILEILESIKQELLWPNQIVKTVNHISKAIEIGKRLPKKQRNIFNRIPDPLSYFSVNEVYRLYRKGLTVNVDVCQGWSEVNNWLRSVLNSTTVNHMFQKLSIRYPIINMVNTAEEITQEMVSIFGYQMNIIESYMSYIVGYNKAFALHQSSQEPNKVDADTDSKTSLMKTNHINDIKMHIENEKTSLKMDLLHKISLWCNAYFYKNLRECPLDFRDTGMGDSLSDLLNAHRFLVDHNDALDRIQQPEASFVQEYNFTLPGYCKCFMAKQQQPHSVLVDGYDSGYMNDFACAQRTIKSTENRDTGSLDDLLDIANTCFNNKIKQLHNFNAFSLKIDSQDDDFADKINVMVNRIDVILHGARTTTHELKLYIANTGIYELKTNKNTFVVYEDTLLQELLYDISFNQSLLANQPTTRSGVSDVNKVKSELSNFEETVDELKQMLNTRDDQTQGNSPMQSFMKNNLITNSDIDTGGDRTSENIAPKYKTRLNKSLFANWILMAPSDKNPGLDTHTVKKITVKISGTFRSFIKKNAFFL